jgi:hypothetical protein
MQTPLFGIWQILPAITAGTVRDDLCAAFYREKRLIAHMSLSCDFWVEPRLLLGHRSLKTTMVYSHVHPKFRDTASHLDRL